MFQFLQNVAGFLARNAQIVAILAVVLLPVLTKIGSWLQEQAVKRKAEAERRHRLESRLRTGRDTSTPPPPQQTAPAQTETFADRRRKQIEAMREREAAARRQREAVQRGTQPAQPQASAGAPVAQASSPTIDAQQRILEAVGATAGQGARRRRRAEPKADKTEDLAAQFVRRDRQIAAKDARELGVAIPGSAAIKIDRKSLRQAIVMAEVLSSPVALRNPDQHSI